MPIMEVPLGQCPDLEFHVAHYWCWVDSDELQVCPGRDLRGASAITGRIAVADNVVSRFNRDWSRAD